MTGKPALRLVATTIVVPLVVALLAVAALGALAAPAVAQEAEVGVQGRLVNEDNEPVEGVTILVEQDGEEIGTDETDAEGRWAVRLPGAGTYQVSLLTDTLPEDVSLRDPDRATLDRVRVREGQVRTVLFPLGERAGGGTARFERLMNLAVDGVRLGLIIALASIGLSLVYSVTGLVNFAHGELVTFGALAAFFFSASGAVGDWPLVAAAVMAAVSGGVLGFGLERGLFRPLRRRRSGNVSLIVVTIGLSLVMRHVYLIVFGGRPRPFDEFTIQRAVSLGPISLRPKDWVVMAVAVAALVGVALLLQRTRLGTAMRAVSDSGELASASGVDVQRVILYTWVLGAGLAALGGVLQGVSETVVWDMGFALLLLMFAAVILGGIGTAYGAMVGGILIGVTSQVSTYWLDPRYRIGVGLAVLIGAILVRPQGLLGRAERVG